MLLKGAVKQPRYYTRYQTGVLFLFEAKTKKKDYQYRFTGEIRTHGFFLLFFLFFLLAGGKENTVARIVSTLQNFNNAICLTFFPFTSIYKIKSPSHKKRKYLKSYLFFLYSSPPKLDKDFAFNGFSFKQAVKLGATTPTDAPHFFCLACEQAPGSVGFRERQPSAWPSVVQGERDEPRAVW